MSEIEIVVIRHFDAPAARVFDAWLDPAAVGHWLFATPTGEMLHVEVDARVGGEFVIAEKRGEQVAEHFGRYMEIDRPKRLVFTFAADRTEKPSLVVVEITPDDTGCELRLTHTMDAKWAEYADRTRSGWTMVLAGLHNEITADRQIVMTRIFDAPRDLVWHAWTDPDHVDHWWGPNGFLNETLEMEVRAGGMWRYVMHGPDGTDYDNRIVYREVVAPERLVYRHSSDIDDDPMAFEVTVTFAAQGDKTHLTMRSLFATVEQQKATVAFGAIEGGQQTLSRLADYLTQIDQ
jgi:uncharacterized protein YndB with AHSA1/START domain